MRKTLPLVMLLLFAFNGIAFAQKKSPAILLFLGIKRQKKDLA